jgi:hypothetical protein
MTRPSLLASLALLCAAGLLGCGQSAQPASGTSTASDKQSAPAHQESPPVALNKVHYDDITNSSGIDFVHRNGSRGERWMAETNGAGCAFLDYDNDGFLDIILLQSGELPGQETGPRQSSRLYHNNHDKTFTDVTERAKFDARGYAMGVACADYDNDGFTDVFIANFGKDQLFKNAGDGTFRDVTDSSGAGDPLWSSCAAFADFDNDGDLDLYVVNYVNMSMDGKPIRGIEHFGNKLCGVPRNGKQIPTYCSPDVYLGIPSTLDRNNGDGTFTDVSEESGIHNVSPKVNKPQKKRIEDRSKGLGIVLSDLDDDGLMDIFIANDSTENFLFMNKGNLRFEEQGDERGVAYDGQGKTEACMGTDFADVNGDGNFDLIAVNLAFETYTLWINQGKGFFEDQTVQYHLAEPSYRMVGFGAKFLDFDNDGDQDLVVANGHVVDNIEEIDPALTYAQPAHLYENLGKPPWFKLLGASAGSYFGERHVGRGLAAGDIDNDGDLDLLFSNNNERAYLLENKGGCERSWIGLELVGTRSNRNAIGALVAVTAGGKTQRNEVRGASSYASYSDQRLLFGLGSAEQVDRVDIRWPSGQRQTLTNPALRRYHRLEEPK